jgi:hypothetical protein
MSTQGWSTAIQEVTEKRHRRTVDELESERKRLIALLDDKDSQLDAALAITSSKPKAAKIVLPPAQKDELTAVAVASDWHVEETVDRKTVNGLNAFSLEIAEQRINKFFTNIVKLTETQRHGAKIDRLMLILGGDLMTGYIHEELQEQNALSPTETVLWLQDRIASGLDLLNKHFGEIIVPCVYGNHGRTTRKPRHATGAANSYEWMLYHIMAKQLADKANWHVSDGYHLLMELYGKTLRIHHGDGLKYQGGIGGLTIPVEKAIASWNKGITADLDIFGHWHQSQQNPKWVCNGSLIGHNAYSVAIKAPYESPTQTYFLFDPKHGRTGTFPIILE